MIILKKYDDKLYNSLLERMEGVKTYEGGTGSYFYCICPYHQSEPVRASLAVYRDGHDFHCKSCGEYGSLEKLYAKVSHTPQARLDTVSSHPRIPFMKWLRKYGSYEAAAEAAYQTAIASPFLVSYFKTRKIDPYIKQGRFGYLDGYYSFPVYDEERSFVDWVVRSSPRKVNVDSKYGVMPHERGSEVHLYSPSWKRVAKSDKIYVPFGMIDSWTLYAAGVASITAITGQTINTSMFSKIRKQIIVIPDLGEEVAARKFVRELGWRGKLLLVDYPDGMKDLNQVHVSFGIEKVQELLTL